MLKLQAMLYYNIFLFGSITLAKVGLAYGRADGEPLVPPLGTGWLWSKDLFSLMRDAGQGGENG